MHLYKKFFINFISLCILFLALIMGINYFIDGGNQFYHSATIEGEIANILLSNKSIMVSTNYNDRLLQKKMLRNLNNSPNVLVLGSSHSLPISHQALNTTSFYNASVSSGYLEDDIALYYLFQERGWQPKTLVICLDPWIINKHFATLFGGDEIQLWKSSLSYEYYAAKHFLLGVGGTSWGANYDKFSSLLEKYSQLITLDYTKASVREIIRSIFKRNEKISLTVLSSNINCLNCNIKQADGALLPSQNLERLTSEQVGGITKNMLSLISTFYYEFPPIDTENKKIFEYFITYLVSKNIKVVFYFPPLEPSAYDHFFKENKNYQSIKIVETYFTSLANKYHLEIVGSYNPTLLGLTTNDFIDMWHLKAQGIKKIFNKKDHNLWLPESRNT